MTTLDFPYEIVGLFHDRDPLEACVKSLREAGFSAADLSVLASHESIETTKEQSLKDSLLPFLDEIRYETPLINAGLIALASGPAGAAIAALVAAGLGGAAIKELVEETTSTVDGQALEAALSNRGALLWVLVKDADGEAKARQALEAQGAENVHRHKGSEENA